MLIIQVLVNNKPIAAATAVNKSSLADLSDYEVQVVEYGAPALGIEPSHVAAKITGHERKQSVWALIKKIAEAGCE